MTKKRNAPFIWDAQLSDREVFLVGKIVIQWGALQHELFLQTLMTFETAASEHTPLPKAMNNMQFTELLELWKARVIDRAEGKRAGVLQLQLEEICRLKEFRDALVHGMWDWSAADLSRVTTVRIRRKEIITTHFTADDLEDIYRRTATINFNVRFPGGPEDWARKRAEQGSYISRRGLSMFTRDPTAKDWLPIPTSKKPK